MKRKSILVMLCAMTTIGAFAQKNLVEDVEHSIGSYNADFKAACEKIEPALTNPETKDDAKTWFVAGKANFGLYDNSFAYLQAAQKVDTLAMGNALLKGYKYFMTALPLDSVKQTDKHGNFKRDKKGNIKIKTKYSKDIVNQLVGHFNDFWTAGAILYEKGHYAEAAQSFGIYVDMPTSGIAEREKFLAADSTLGMAEYYQGLALWQSDDLKGAVEAFADARKLGFLDKEVFDYAMSCCYAMKDTEGYVAIAREALPLYGDKDSQYINILINDAINKNNFEEAEQMIDKALALNPNNAELYNVKGALYEQKKELDKAMEYYKEAISIDPNYANGQFNVGRCIMIEAVNVQKELETMKGEEYTTARETRLVPLFKEALPYLEKAFELDDTNTSARSLLRNIYYQLGDETKLNALEQK